MKQFLIILLTVFMITACCACTTPNNGPATATEPTPAHTTEPEKIEYKGLSLYKEDSKNEIDFENLLMNTSNMKVKIKTTAGENSYSINLSTGTDGILLSVGDSFFQLRDMGEVKDDADKRHEVVLTYMDASITRDIVAQPYAFKAYISDVESLLNDNGGDTIDIDSMTSAINESSTNFVGYYNENDKRYDVYSIAIPEEVFVESEDEDDFKDPTNDGAIYGATEPELTTDSAEELKENGYIVVEHESKTLSKMFIETENEEVKTTYTMDFVDQIDFRERSVLALEIQELEEEAFTEKVGEVFFTIIFSMMAAE